jgi:cell division protein FtsW
VNTMQPYVPGKRQPAHMPKGKLSRWSELKIWWREIDRVLLLLVLLLMSFGTIAVAAASPASCISSTATLPGRCLRWARCSACRC